MDPQCGLLTGPKMLCHSQRKGPDVSLALNQGEEDRATSAVHKITGNQALTQNLVPFCSFDMIVGGLTGNDHVVYVALAQSGAGYADKTRYFLQVGDGSATQVSHPGAQSAD